MATKTPARSTARSTRGAAPAITAKTFKTNFDTVVQNIETVIKGKTDVVRLAMVAILCEGHILFEDLPGTGKSMLARAIGESIGAGNSRIQCTPDMLPGDITGSSILNPKTYAFDFQAGPVFTNILLADEINRATPKTQSALLEAMAERRVTADGITYDLPRPFFVLATQNPIEQAGTFPLPEAQLDRFLFKLAMGYMNRASEFEVMFDNSISLSINDIKPVIDGEVINAMINYAGSVRVADDVGYYIVDLIQATRNDPSIAAGGSPRASIALLRAARVLAASDGREDVYPDDVRTVLRPVLAHRVVLHPDAMLRGDNVDAVLERVTATVKPPVTGGKGRTSQLKAVEAS